MRVLVQALTAAPGGSINVLATLLRNWPPDDDIVCITWRPEMARALRETDHRVVQIQADSTPAAMWRLTSVLRRRIERWQPDVIFAQQYSIPRMSAPQVVHHRNLLRFEPIRGAPLRARAQDAAVQATLFGSALSVFNSHTLREAAIERWPQLANRRTTVVHNPVDMRHFEKVRTQRDSKTMRILVPQSDMRHKRNDVAVEVLRIVANHLKAQGDARQLEMTFVGTGDYITVRTAAARLGMENRIRLPGYLASQDLATVYAESDLALITSEKESFCNPIVEAHAAGVPIVTTPLPVFSEISGPLSVASEAHTAEALAGRVVEVVNRTPPDTDGFVSARRYAQAFAGPVKARELRGALLRVRR